MRSHRVTLDDGQIQLIKIALAEMRRQLKIEATRQRVKAVVTLLVEAETRVIDSPTLLEAVR